MIPMPIDSMLMPNTYNGMLYFEDAKPEFNISVPFTLAIYYTSSLIAQRWNDVLAIRNDATMADIMGERGYPYDFSAVQWYLNGQPIEGATQALGESGEKFVCGSETWQNVSLTNVVSVNATLTGSMLW